MDASPVLDELASQLDADDELLVVCDAEPDPLADAVAELDGARLVVAGEPERCSGKANAIAAGMEAAANDRLVWTDDDFYHPPDWLAELDDAYEREGPVSELPFFIGKDWLSTLLEPDYALAGMAGVYAGEKAWGGGVVFERGDLDVDAFLHDLRRTASDDGLLSEYLDVTPLKRVRRVAVGGSLRETLERHVRFTQIVQRHEPGNTLFMALLSVITVAFCLAFPLYAAVVVTLFFGGVYAFFGVRRWTFLFGYPAVLAQLPLMAYALGRRTFV